MSETRTYAFGDVRADRARMTLERAGQPVDLEPKGFDVLFFLIDARERLVTKEELLEKVWAGTFVTANALTRVIAQLRKAIGDDAHEGRYIQTVAKRGYRFVAPVEIEGAAGESEPLPEQRAAVSTSRRLSSWWVTAAVLAVLIAGAAAATRMMRERPTDSAARPQARLERLTTRLGYNGAPAISPDGRLVAYVSDRTGSKEIYVTSFTAGAQELAITSDGAQNVAPAWSPDGQWLAYQSEQKSGIWIVAATGGVPRQVVDFGTAPDWSPDGQWLVFQSTANAISQLWLVRRDGSERRQLTKLGSPPGGHMQPAWSTSGRWIAFVAFRFPNIWNLEVISPATGEHHLVAMGAWGPRFAREDRAIVYTTRSGTSSPFIVRQGFDPETGKPEGATELVHSIEGAPDGFSVARNGTIAIGVAQPDANLWALDLDAEGNGGDVHRLTADSVRNGRAVYGPNGRLAFVRAGVGAKQTTWLIDDDGKNLEPLIVDRENGQPLWGGDGSRVLVRYDPAPGEMRFWWVDVATRRMTVLPFLANEMESSALSYDGRQLAFHGRGLDTVNVFTRSVDGGPPRQVTFDREGMTFPVWSPDGSQIALEVTRGDDTHIGVVGRNGGPVRLLTSGRGQNWPNGWSPDGKWIVFAGQRRGIWNIYAVSPTTSEIRQLTKFTSTTGYVRYPVWSPDGRRIVFDRSQMTAGVWILRAAG